jgi:hypothetical protein
MRTLVVLGMAGLTGSLLLYTSQNVQNKQQELKVLQASVAQERETLQLLNTEWAFLNNPQRLEALSKKFLDLVPPQPNTIVSAPDEIPSRAPVTMQDDSELSAESINTIANPLATETVSYEQAVIPAVMTAPLPNKKPGVPERDTEENP